MLALGACATVATGPTFLEAKAPPPPPGMATVYVYRKHAEPLAWGTTILFGSHEIATLSQGGFTWVHVPPGAVPIRATWPALSGQTGAALELRVEPDRTYFIEVQGVSRGFCIGAGCITTRIGSKLNEVCLLYTSPSPRDTR